VGAQAKIQCIAIRNILLTYHIRYQCSTDSLFIFAAILILYLTTWLNFDDSTATSIYHAFVVLCYFSPLFGAITADGYLGKYKSVFKSYIFSANFND